MRTLPIRSLIHSLAFNSKQRVFRTFTEKICDNIINWKFLVILQIIKFMAVFNCTKQIVNGGRNNRSVVLLFCTTNELFSLIN